MDKTGNRHRWTARASYSHQQRRHKFAVGEVVNIHFAVTSLGSKTAKAAVTNSAFEIVRLLPEQESSFHYRVKNATTGQERVIAEEQILPA